MSWWEYIVFAIVVIVAVWGFASLIRVQSQYLTHRTDRTAQDLYNDFAESSRQQRKYARRHGGEWRNE